MHFTEIKYNAITLWSRITSKYFDKNAVKKTNSLNLTKIDEKQISLNENEILLFAILRNESLRLPHFIKYYKELGVDKFFFVDNNSTDNSADMVLKEKHAHLFFTKDSYVNHWNWMEYLLETYGKNHWCVVVDIDELFSFPNDEYLNLQDLITYMEQGECTSIRAFLLDMYSNTNVNTSSYLTGGNPLEIVSYFDKDYQKLQFSFPDRSTFQAYTALIFSGGMRDRVFGKIALPHILSKIPLFKNIKGTYLSQGMHAINGSKISDIQGVVFHTKFLSDFIDEVKEEVKREEHYGGALYYKHFHTKIGDNQEISFYHKDSVKYVDSQQLVNLGLMKTNERFEQFCSDIKEKKTQNVVSAL